MLDNFFPLYVIIFIFTLVLTALIEKKLIPAFRKNAKQPIYAEGPKWHIKKSGTPTMGGLGFLLAIFIAIPFSLPFLLQNKGADAALSVIISLSFAILNSAVGMIDDIKKLKRKENQGLTPMQKLILQLISAVIFLLARKLLLQDDTSIAFAFGEVELGFLYYPLTVFMLLGIINCANLTDGIDGLATSVAFSIGVSMLYISSALFEEVAIISSAIIGASVGFLIFNLHPAKIFMGDTGSLFFGALIASCGFALGNPFIAIPIAIVYVIEGISVILQVFFFKITGKRIFKMAPLHHHFEQCGWSENKICIVAMLMTFIFSIPAYIFYLP